MTLHDVTVTSVMTYDVTGTTAGVISRDDKTAVFVSVATVPTTVAETIAASSVNQRDECLEEEESRWQLLYFLYIYIFFYFFYTRHNISHSIISVYGD